MTETPSVLVPLEPTEEMRKAGRLAVGWHAAPEHFAVMIYRAMLSARPDVGEEFNAVRERLLGAANAFESRDAFVGQGPAFILALGRRVAGDIRAILALNPPLSSGGGEGLRAELEEWADRQLVDCALDMDDLEEIFQRRLAPPPPSSEEDGKYSSRDLSRSDGVALDGGDL